MCAIFSENELSQWYHHYFLVLAMDVFDFMSIMSLLDSMFDVCNSRSKFDRRKSLRCGYGVHLDEQLDALLKGYNLVKGLRAKGKRVHMPWQRGMMITSASIMKLHDELMAKYAITYILTSRLNQDVTEGTFAVIRRMGGTYTNPTPLSFAQRLKNYLLGSCSDVVVESAPVQMEQVDVLTSEVDHDPVDHEGVEDAKVLTADVGQGLEAVNSEDIDEPFMDEDMMAAVSESMYTVYPCFILHLTHPFSVVESRTISEEHGMAYVGGYVARACHETHLYRTKFDHNKDPTEFVESSWMKDKDFGSLGNGLCFPSKAFYNDLLKMEAMFEHFHSGYRNNYNPDKEIVAKFATLLSKEFKEYSTQLLKKLAKTRTMIRVRSNQKLINDGHFESARSLRKKVEHKF